MKLIANMQAVDRRTIEECGVLGLDLMEAAGTRVAEAVLRQSQEAGLTNPRVVIVCGNGNNGGDGLVVARVLADRHLENIRVLLATERLPGDALMNFNRLRKVKSVSTLPMVDHLDKLEDADIIVDAVFGTGLSRPVEGFPKTLLESMNRARESHQAYTIAVDIPSGVNSATGDVMGLAVCADETVTFQCGKPGLYLHPGKQHAGRVHVVDIGIPQRMLDEAPEKTFLLSQPVVQTFLPTRPEEGHKYTFGSVLVIGGSKRMPGAAALSSEAVLSAGAGSVTLAAPKSVFTGVLPEVMRKPLAENSEGVLHPLSYRELAKEEIASFDVFAVGPGMGHAPETFAFFEDTLKQLLALENKTIVLDADALNCLAQKPVALGERIIITPHVGEARRLLGIEKDDPEPRSLIEMALGLRQKFGAQVVLKSATTVVAGSDGNVWINNNGNTGLTP